MKEVLEMDCKIIMMRRKWWQFYKKGWHKHKDFFNRKWWVSFKYDEKFNK